MFITESGLYKLVLKSRKKEAVKFQDWVTDELLPTIRRQGYYVMEGRIAELEKSLRKSEEQRELMSRSIATYTPWKDMPEGGHTRRGSNVKPAETAQLPTTDGRHYRNAIRKAVKSRIIEDWVLDQFRMSIEVDLIKGTKHTKNEERLLSLLAIHAITVQVTIGA